MLMWSLIRCTYVLLTRICYSSSNSIVTSVSNSMNVFTYVHFFSLSVCFSVIGKQFSAQITWHSLAYSDTLIQTKRQTLALISFFLGWIFYIKFTQCNGQFNKIETSIVSISLARSLLFLLLSMVFTANVKQTTTKWERSIKREEEEKPKEWIELNRLINKTIILR